MLALKGKGKAFFFFLIFLKLKVMHSWLFGGVSCVFCILLSFFLIEYGCAVWFIYLGAIHTDLLIKYALVSQSMHLPHKLSRHSQFMFFELEKKSNFFAHCELD